MLWEYTILPTNQLLTQALLPGPYRAIHPKWQTSQHHIVSSRITAKPQHIYFTFRAGHTVEFFILLCQNNQTSA